MMLRVCVIGMGPIGNRHADMYQADPLAELLDLRYLFLGQKDYKCLDKAHVSVLGWVKC